MIKLLANKYSVVAQKLKHSILNLNPLNSFINENDTPSIPAPINNIKKIKITNKRLKLCSNYSKPASPASNIDIKIKLNSTTQAKPIKRTRKIIN